MSIEIIIALIFQYVEQRLFCKDVNKTLIWHKFSVKGVKWRKNFIEPIINIDNRSFDL